jgi:hypothetical protein
MELGMALGAAGVAVGLVVAWMLAACRRRAKVRPDGVMREWAMSGGITREQFESILVESSSPQDRTVALLLAGRPTRALTQEGRGEDDAVTRTLGRETSDDGQEDCVSPDDHGVRDTQAVLVAAVRRRERRVIAGAAARARSSERALANEQARVERERRRDERAVARRAERRGAGGDTPADDAVVVDELAGSANGPDATPTSRRARKQRGEAAISRTPRVQRRTLRRDAAVQGEDRRGQRQARRVGRTGERTAAAQRRAADKVLRAGERAHIQALKREIARERAEERANLRAIRETWAQRLKTRGGDDVSSATAGLLTAPGMIADGSDVETLVEAGFERSDAQALLKERARVARVEVRAQRKSVRQAARAELAQRKKDNAASEAQRRGRLKTLKRALADERASLHGGQRLERVRRREERAAEREMARLRRHDAQLGGQASRSNAMALRRARRLGVPLELEAATAGPLAALGPAGVQTGGVRYDWRAAGLPEPLPELDGRTDAIEQGD